MLLNSVMSAAKKHKIKCSVNLSSKEDSAVTLAEVFVENKFVKLHTQDLGNVGRSSVETMKEFFFK